MSSTLKDRFFNKETIKSLSTVISQAHPGFNSKRFLSLIFDSSWKDRELKDRMHHVSSTLNEVIDKPYEQALEIVLEANRNLSSGFVNMVFPDFVEQYGIEHLKLSMQALKELTSGSSSEFAVRPFIRRYGLDAMSFMYEWSHDTNEHVRRLSSEGCRPLLPWSNPLADFVKDPTPILPILQQLKYDSALYVQKSVGNSMNDISKNHPDIVLKMCKEWKIEQETKRIKNSKKQIEEQSNRNSKDSIDFIIHKACRTLLKKGNQEALELFKVGQKESVHIQRLRVINKKVEIGGIVEFEFEVVAGNKEKKGKEEEGRKERLNKQQEEVGQSVEGLRRSKRLNVIAAQKKQITGTADEDKEDTEENNTIKPSKKPKKGKELNKEITKQDTSNEEPDHGQLSNDSKSLDDSAIHLLRLEYKIAYLKSNGTHSSKIFMFKNNFSLNHGASVKLKGSQKMQQLSTRKHYPGKHYIEILVNGVMKAKTEFMLIGKEEEEEEEEEE